MKINKNYIGLFLISLATLMLEISLIRFFSIAQFYHFAFMVISIALFGIAASGTFLFVKKIKNPLFLSSILFSLFTIIGFFVTNNLSFDQYKAVTNIFHILILFVYYLFLSLPFFFFGIIIAFIFSQNQKNSGIVYFYNLSGSALGTILTIPFLSFLNVKIIFLISLIGLVAAVFFINNRKFFKLIQFLIAINLFLFFIKIDTNVSQYKELNQALNVPNSELITTKWNSAGK